MILSTLILTVSLAAPQAAGPAPSQAFVRKCRWWLDAGVRRELALTRGQVAAIEAEFHRTLKYRQWLRRDIDAAEGELTRLLARDDVSEVEVEPLVSLVEDLRRRRNVARVQLLVAIYFVLKPSQRSRLSSLMKNATRGMPSHCLTAFNIANGLPRKYT